MQNSYFNPKIPWENWIAIGLPVHPPELLDPRQGVLASVGKTASAAWLLEVKRFPLRRSQSTNSGYEAQLDSF